MPDGSTRHLHASKIRKFVARVQGVGVVNVQDEDFGPIECVTMPNQVSEPTSPSQRINPQQLEHLSPEQFTRLLAVLDDLQIVLLTLQDIVPSYLMRFEFLMVFNLKLRGLTGYRNS